MDITELQQKFIFKSFEIKRLWLLLNKSAPGAEPHYEKQYIKKSFNKIQTDKWKYYLDKHVYKIFGALHGTEY